MLKGEQRSAEGHEGGRLGFWWHSMGVEAHRDVEW